ncbi:hypothetical protein L0Z72_01075 [candidate division KSB1 bacterium]|nr:hypothetical protein [candidate division KSB1 bacterium]
MKTILNYLMIFLAVATSGCYEKNPVDILNILPNVYVYSGFDSSQVKIISGWFMLLHQDSVNVSGSWEFQKIGEPQQIGPQVGTGAFKGVIDDERISIDLNPDYRDNNVILNGVVSGDTISGSWMYVGFAGPINSGTFQATKQ